MIKRFLVVSIVPLVLVISGCSFSPPPQPVVVTPTAPQPAQNKEMLKALAQLVEIKQELKSLRNTVDIAAKCYCWAFTIAPFGKPSGRNTRNPFHYLKVIVS